MSAASGFALLKSVEVKDASEGTFANSILQAQNSIPAKKGKACWGKISIPGPRYHGTTHHLQVLFQQGLGNARSILQVLTDAVSGRKLAKQS